MSPPARHLLRAKDLADGRYFETLGVEDLARAARQVESLMARGTVGTVFLLRLIPVMLPATAWRPRERGSGRYWARTSDYCLGPPSVSQV